MNTGVYSTPSSSTSNMRVALGGIVVTVKETRLKISHNYQPKNLRCSNMHEQ